MRLTDRLAFFLLLVGLASATLLSFLFQRFQEQQEQPISSLLLIQQQQQKLREKSNLTKKNRNLTTTTAKGAPLPQHPKREPPLTKRPFSINSTAAATASTAWKPNRFHHYDGVVMVTKIHGPNDYSSLQQMLCLWSQAYNKNAAYYDIVVFTTLPLSEGYTVLLKDIVAPARINIVVDNPGLPQMLQTLQSNKSLQDELVQRCLNVKSIHDIQWSTQCVDTETINGNSNKATKSKATTTDPLQYCWQAEFRAKYIWTHPALKDYQYMIWMDSDAYCTKPWDFDPIQMVVENNLTILFDHFPQGKAVGHDIFLRLSQAFPPNNDDGDKRICSITLQDGHLAAQSCEACEPQGPKRKRRQRKQNLQGNNIVAHIQQVHGFFHITSLDFFRSPLVQDWLHILIDGEKKTNKADNDDGPFLFRRRFDDQLAVTVPTAVWTPHQAWDMESHGFIPHVYHNWKLDGKQPVTTKGFQRWYWPRFVKKQFPEAAAKCQISSNG